MPTSRFADRIPYWPISGFYFFYFGILGTLIPYWNLYLEKIGFDPLEIGLLTGATLVARVVSPYLAGWLVDRSGDAMPVIRGACLMTALLFSLLFWSDSPWWIAWVTFFYNFFWSCSLSQFEANTLLHLDDNTRRYSRIRIWGSIGFIALVVGAGHILEQNLFLLLPILFVLMVFTFLASLLVPQAQKHASRSPSQTPSMLYRSSPIWWFFLICALMQFSHGPYYTFFSIYLENLGYSRTLVGNLWALGVLAEILVFAVMPGWIQRYGVRVLLFGSLLAAVVRWAFIGAFAGELPVVLVAQVLHAATFAIFHSCAMEVVNRAFPFSFRGRGQALYSSLGFGVGGALGGVVAGITWEPLGPVVTFGLGSAAALLAFLLALRLPLAKMLAVEK